LRSFFLYRLSAVCLVGRGLARWLLSLVTNT